jgi:hypothetical protein
LGLAGRGLIEWLTSVLDALDPAPPPQGSYIHLLLDLYNKDAKKVEAILGGSDLAKVSSDFLEELIKLTNDEVNSTRRVLSLLNAESDLSRFDNGLAQYYDEGLGTKFPQVRRLISQTLLELSPDGYRLKSSSPGSTNPEEIVKEMVQASSKRLDTILGQIRDSY